MKINIDVKPAKFSDDFKHILESENPISLSFENYERVCEVIKNKQGLVYDDILYRDACNKALDTYKDNTDIFYNEDFKVNLYAEYKEIFDNDFYGSVPEEGEAMYNFLNSFESGISDHNFDYNDEQFVLDVTSSMFGIIYDYELNELISYLSDIKYEFTNNEEKLNKLAMDEIIKFAIEPWLSKTGFRGIIGEGELVYKLDEIVVQSYCKCDFETTMALYIVNEVSNEADLSIYSEGIQNRLNIFKDLFIADESTEGKIYSDDTINIAREIYEFILNDEINKFILENQI